MDSHDPTPAVSGARSRSMVTDWKFLILVVGQLLAVGVMYGRMTLELDNAQKQIGEIKTSIDGIRSDAQSSSRAIAVLIDRNMTHAETNHSFDERITRLEREAFRYGGPRSDHR